MLRLHARILLGLELLELLRDLGPGAAGNPNVATTPCHPAMAERDRALPAALGLIPVGRSFVASATPGASGVTTHD
jgi:hypothetical protein